MNDAMSSSPAARRMSMSTVSSGRTAEGDDAPPPINDLPIEPDVGVTVAAPSWQNDGATTTTITEALPCSITGPAHVLELLAREAPAGAKSDCLEAFLSPPNRITIKGERARLAGIPSNAAYYAFFYPLPFLSSEYHRLVDVEEEKTAPWLFFLLLGGYCYFDDARRLIQTNAFVGHQTERKLTLAGPFLPSDEAVEALRKAGRLREVTLAPLREQGFERFAWVVPGERPGGAPLLADGSDLTNNGAFLYEGGDVEAVLYTVVNKALLAALDVENTSTTATMLSMPARRSSQRGDVRSSAAQLLEKWQSKLVDRDRQPRQNLRRQQQQQQHNNNNKQRQSLILGGGAGAADRKSTGSSEAREEELSAWIGFVPLVVQQQLALIADTELASSALPPPRQMQAAAIFADASGFTALTERLSRLPDGAERMCAIMNSFLGEAIRIVHEHGGQILKFAGDALSAIFEADDDERPMGVAVECAARCAFRMHESLHGFVAWKPSEKDHSSRGSVSRGSVTTTTTTNGAAQPITLSLHIGLGCGAVGLMHLGGHQSRLEYVAAGTAISEAARAEPFGVSGETIASEAAWGYLKQRGVCTAEPVLKEEEEEEEEGQQREGAPQKAGEGGGGGGGAATKEDHGAGLFKLGKCLLAPLSSPIQTVAKLRATKLSSAARTQMMRNYVPRAVTVRLAEGVVRAAASGPAGDASLSEIRQATVLFINLKGLRLDRACEVTSEEGRAALEAAQATMLCVQEEVHYMEGEVNKMLVDDKGTVLLCVFGLPPRSHPDDPLRAVRTALLLADLLDGSSHGEDDGGGGDEECRPVACIGVGSGRVFCGTVGTIERREFTTMGDAVNLSARLMQQASKPGASCRVLVDEATMSHTRKTIHYNPLPRVRLKGKAGAMGLYAPLAELEDASDAHSLISRMGRDSEFRQLRGMVSNLLIYNGGGGNIMLVGSQGSGKRALVAALAEFGTSARMIVLRSELRDHQQQLRDTHRTESLLKFEKKFSDLGRQPSITSIGSELSLRSISDRASSVYGPERSSMAASSQRSIREDLLVQEGEEMEEEEGAGGGRELLLAESSLPARMIPPPSTTSSSFSSSAAGAPPPVIQRSQSEAPTTINPRRGSSTEAALMAVRFGSSLRSRARRHQVRQMLPVTADLAEQLLAHGTSALGVSKAQFVRDALEDADRGGGSSSSSSSRPHASSASTSTATSSSSSSSSSSVPARSAPPPPSSSSSSSGSNQTEAASMRARRRWGKLRAVVRLTSLRTNKQSAQQSLLEHGWLLGELLDDTTVASLLPPPPAPQPAIASLASSTTTSTTFSSGAIPDAAAAPSSSATTTTTPEELGLGDKCRLLLRMVLALLRRLVLAPSGGGPRLMLLLHLDAGSSGDVPIWTWRLARMISHAINGEGHGHGHGHAVSGQGASGISGLGGSGGPHPSPPPPSSPSSSLPPSSPSSSAPASPSSPPLPVMLCVVTSAVSAIHSAGSDEEWNPFAVERAQVLSDLKSSAVRSDSFLKLEPLTRLAQHSYALQVLRAKHAYSGTLDGVPDSMLEFVVSRSGGKPVFIEQMLDVLEQQELLQFAYDEEGLVDKGAEIVQEVDSEVLDALPTPHNIRSEVLQLFETLDPALQTALRLAAPMDAFSEAMLTDVGLPSRIVRRLAHLFNMAVDEGILEGFSRAIPLEVLSADPTAAHAWGWRMGLVRREVLQAMLATEVQRVERKIRDLRTFHSKRGGTAPPPGAAPALAFSDAGKGMRRTSLAYPGAGAAAARRSSNRRSSDTELLHEHDEGSFSYDHPAAAPMWHSSRSPTRAGRTIGRQVDQAVQVDLPRSGGTRVTRRPWLSFCTPRTAAEDVVNEGRV